MAYAAVASVSETIDIILKYHKNSISREFEDQIRSLQKHSVFLQSFLEDFRDRGNNWDETIREVSDRAEEIIELSLSDLLMLETTSGGSSSSKCELEGVSEEMESIVNRVKGKAAETIDGGDKELMQIICRLCEGSSSREVIAIVGMGGMGKAALAKKAYDHPLIVDRFEIRAWATVDIDFGQIILDLLRCMKAEPGLISDSDDDEMRRICKILHSRRYLIILNDVLEIEAWDRLKHMFPDTGNGSRIILTTMVSGLGEAAGASYIHAMRLLDAENSWNAVRQNVFRGDPCPWQLESVGKTIARCCAGHPLFIQLLSGVLAAADQTPAAWQDILEYMIKTMKDVHSTLFDLLAVCYTYLPHHLKPCFLYLGCFPDDHEIRLSKVIKLWIAEGFLNETESKSCEDIGEERVEDLVRRGLVSVTKWKSSSSKSDGARRRIKSIKIHHLMRGLCLHRADIDNFNYADPGTRSLKLLSRRRVSTDHYICHIFNDLLEGVYDSTIRTIIFSSDAARSCCFPWSIANLRLLRVLDLLGAHYKGYEHELFNLFHLRYLALRCVFSISDAISKLQNLQTLIIRSSRNDDEVFDDLGDGIWIDDLGDGIWRMPQLRHVFIFHFKLPTHQIGDNVVISALEDLQTLSGVANFICSRDNLKMIPNLQKLCLLYINMNSTDVVQDYQLHNLIYLHKLQILKLEIHWPLFSKQQHKMSCAFQFPPTLKKLNLCGVQLPWEDLNKIVDSLPNLQVLKLRNHACIGQTWETSEGGLSQLIYLMIEDSNLENWKTETSHFPNLKHLVLRRCPSLLEVPIHIGNIQTLELIELDEENRSLLSSANWIQKDRQSSGDDRLSIRVV